ncbi:GNAT family N-acetyltransferase [Mycobacterium shinjukuense]|nr:GNAT family N-acetyltransferase [Mycobacterium shinjukuense]MCV6984548.1 GNAT family N-acetyltransferase [Mycobacterium shinjukuense]
MEFHRPCLLDVHQHRRDEFDCGDASLNDWLQRYAGQNRRRDTAATWVVADDQSRVAAYACVSMTSIDRSAAPQRLAKGAPARVPGLLIGRLGVDQRADGHGLGTALVHCILRKAVEINVMAACRAVVVNALNPGAVRWWQRFGFVPFDPNDESNLDLYLLTGVIERTLAEASDRLG